MNKKLQILILEDQATDAELIERELRQEGLLFTARRVWTEPEFRAGLREPGLDLILADHALPSYDGLSALRIAQQECPEVPFIFVSGNLGEELAIDSMLHGATDYVLKNRLDRLRPAVRRVLREAGERRARQQAEAAVARSKADWERTFDAVPDLIAIIGPEHRIIRVNRALATRLGTTPDQCVGLRCHEAVHGLDHPPEFCPHARLLLDGQEHVEEVCEPRLHGEFLVTTSPLTDADGRLTGSVHVARDITEHKRADAHIVHLNQLLRVIREINRLIVHEPEAPRLLARACACLQQTRGYLLVWVGGLKGDSKQVVPMAWAGPREDYLSHVTITADDSPTGQGPVGTALRTRQPWLCQDTATDPRFALWRAPALERGYRSLASMPMVHGDRLFGVISVYTDHPDAFDGEEMGLLKELADDLALALESIENKERHQQAEVSLRESETRFREQARLLELAQDAIIVRDMGGCIQFWNQGAATLYGWKAEEALGRTVTELFEADPEKFQSAHEQLLRLGQWTGERHLRAKDGRELVAGIRWTLVRDAQGQPKSVLAIHTDLTEKKQLEAQFLRAQRLEGLGLLASGIAHDLNNILAPIVMAAPMLRELEDEAEAKETLAMIQANVQRGTDIIRQLLIFGRGLKGERAPLQLQHIIKAMGTVIRETFPRDLIYQQTCPADLWPIVGDATQLHQVLMNLCVNARDAMPQGGALTVRAANCHLNEHQAAFTPEAHAGPYVVLEVQDTGMGIPPENLERIFDPFFTTKALGYGTGLGLSTVLGIVKSHGGFLQVESTLGQGTRFIVNLPASPDALTMAAPIEQPPAPTTQGELVLVVDDESAIRNVTQRMLEKHGYRVLLAKDGAEALAVYAQHAGQIKLVLTDLMMPVMDGAALAAALRRLEPELPIAATTGDMASPAQQRKMAQLKDLGVTVFLIKPYGATPLLQAIHELLPHP